MEPETLTVVLELYQNMTEIGSRRERGTGEQPYLFLAPNSPILGLGFELPPVLQ